MREIKFKYIIIREKEEMISKTFSIIDIEFGYMNRWYAANHIGADELKRCQYTGLKDKNGKEIYEGDVLKWRGYEVVNGKQIRPSRILEIEYEYYKLFQVENIIRDNGTLEIIGNIHENPELIK